MLLHHYLELIAEIRKEAEAKIKAILSEISDPKMKAAVEEWEPGDPITPEYPQIDPQKKHDHAEAEQPVAGNIGISGPLPQPIEPIPAAVDGHNPAEPTT